MNTATDARPLRNYVSELKEHRVWETLLNGKPRTWERFCEEVLKAPPGFVDRVCDGVAILEQRGRRGPITGTDAIEATEEARESIKARPGPGAPLGSRNNPKGTPGANANHVSVRLPHAGNNASYLLRRVARFDTANGTDFLGEYERGTYKSARATALASGVIKKPTWLDRLRQAWRNASDEERAAFYQEIAP